MPKDINMKLTLYCRSKIVQGIFFTSEVFQKKEVARCSKYKNMKNGHTQISLTSRCISHHGVELQSVHPTTESSSAVCIKLRSQGYQLSQKTPRCASQCRVKLRSVLPTMESSSEVCFLPRSQALWCASHPGVKLQTAESKSKSLGVSGYFNRNPRGP